KFTTTAMAKEMKSWALFGPPTGKTWNPSKQDKEKYPEVKPLVTNPWTVLGTMAPPAGSGREAPVIASAMEPKAKGKKGASAASANVTTAWRGTLLPQTDGDIWLAIAFADYERLVATELAAVKRGDSAKAARDALEKSIATTRKSYQKASAKLNVSLADLKANPANDDWYGVAAYKGVLLLHELRSDVGDEKFDKAMDAFGMEFGGQRVTSKQFQTHMEKATGRKLEAFFETWLKGKGLPKAGEKAKGGNGAELSKRSHGIVLGIAAMAAA
ncbi:MAG TPA: M1 family aminopeptidase, partial [Gemmataceae bacterium]|nr:M1 family aminopeptidase [Gemmataceae bacterium]